MADNNKMMTDEELLAILAAHEKSAMGNSSAAGMTVTPNSPQTMTTLELDNYNALNYYYGRPLGNEQPDRSQVVIPELRDTVEWVMPQLMRMFAGTDTICRFEPDGPDDEKLAEQQTDACNYIFMRKNPGWMVLHDYFKDALLLRNGYIKVYYETKRSIRIESYTGLDQDAVALLMQNAEEDGDKIEILGQTARPIVLPVPHDAVMAAMQQMQGQPPQPGMPQPGMPQPGMPGMPGADTPTVLAPQIVYDLKIRRVSESPSICIECVPREEILVSPRTRSTLDDSPYYCHKEKLSRSDLIARGYDRDIVNAAQPGPPRWTNLDDLARNNLLDQTQSDESIDPATQEVEVRECYVRVDYDGDGIAEVRRVIVIGDKIADNEEVEEGPLASGTPIRMPHRHVGISLYELLVDIQQIKTTLVRQGLDNVYLANNTRVAVDQDSVNFDDLMTNRPGGIVRSKGTPMDKIMPIQSPNVLGDILQAIEYVDTGMRQWRTGVGADTTTLDPGELQNVAKGNAMALMSKSDLKIEMMARLLAEGLKDAFRKINNLIIRHQDKPMMIELRGKWTKVDPSLWKNRTGVTVNVGLGANNREELRGNLMMLTQVLQQGRAVGIVGPKQAYNAARKMVEALGFNSPEEFVVDPESPQGQQLQHSMQPPPPPQVQAAQINAQARAQQIQLNHQLGTQQIIAQQSAEAEKNRQAEALQASQIQLDHNNKQAEIVLNAIVKLASAALSANALPEQIPADVAAAQSIIRE